MDRIESSLGFDRQKLVALGLLLGCDYCPKGVSGIGKQAAVKFVDQFKNGSEALERLKSLCNEEAVSMTENSIRKKIQSIRDFPDSEIIREFLKERLCDITPSLFAWRRPNLNKFQLFMSRCQEWSCEYSIAKVVTLITLWTMKSRLIAEASTSAQFITPLQIAKKRVKNGRPCFDVQWQKLAEDSVTVSDSYLTQESAALFTSAFPEMVSEFENAQLLARTNKVRKPKTAAAKASVTRKNTTCSKTSSHPSMNAVPPRTEVQLSPPTLDSSFSCIPTESEEHDFLEASFSHAHPDCPKENQEDSEIELLSSKLEGCLKSGDRPVEKKPWQRPATPEFRPNLVGKTDGSDSDASPLPLMMRLQKKRLVLKDNQ